MNCFLIFFILLLQYNYFETFFWDHCVSQTRKCNLIFIINIFKVVSLIFYVRKSALSFDCLFLCFFLSFFSLLLINIHCSSCVIPGNWSLLNHKIFILKALKSYHEFQIFQIHVLISLSSWNYWVAITFQSDNNWGCDETFPDRNQSLTQDCLHHLMFFLQFLLFVSQHYVDS